MTTQGDRNRALSNPMNILVFEPDPRSRREITVCLQSEGHQICECATGDEAIERACRDRFGLLLLVGDGADVDGRQVLTRVREKGVHAPVLILSEGGSADQSIEAFQLGADDFLRKPYVVRELQLRVKNLLRRDVSFG